MTSHIVQITILACVLAATSNVLAQAITAYRSNSPFVVDWVPVIQFILYTCLSAPPNYLWQSFLESTFPAQTFIPSAAGIDAASTATSQDALLDKKPPSTLVETRLNIPNTITKFLIDQTVGAALNNFAFSLAMAGFKGATAEQAIQIAKQDFWPLIQAGWRLWPAVSLSCFTLIKTVEMRALVGGLAGMVWGVYLSLVAEGK